MGTEEEGRRRRRPCPSWPQNTAATRTMCRPESSLYHSHHLIFVGGLSLGRCMRLWWAMEQDTATGRRHAIAVVISISTAVGRQDMAARFATGGGHYIVAQAAFVVGVLAGGRRLVARSWRQGRGDKSLPGHLFDDDKNARRGGRNCRARAKKAAAPCIN